VQPQLDFSFTEGLRALMRQDPDIIMVGEIRDLKTAEMAVQAALTGHLVFSTLHTNDAPSAPSRA
jgi:general secretion pathway protein E